MGLLGKTQEINGVVYKYYKSERVGITQVSRSPRVIGDVVILSEIEGQLVKLIAEGAFENCKNLSAITIGDKVETIGFLAFSDCTNLINVKLSNTVKTILSGAFKNCANLSNICIPNGVKSIGEKADGAGVFENCASLTCISVPYSVDVIGCRAFHGCSNLTSLTIHNSSTVIYDEVCAGRIEFFEKDEIYSSFSGCNRNLVIYCAPGSPVESYAKRWDIKYAPVS
ncbi:MAG: leucine-rich repeat domain-containing protein [Dehalococcoidia bacterium]|nr:leucine-rich repeat domain-containing protein [Dehalococcoidia bacterium]